MCRSTPALRTVAEFLANPAKCCYRRDRNLLHAKGAKAEADRYSRLRHPGDLQSTHGGVVQWTALTSGMSVAGIGLQIAHVEVVDWLQHIITGIQEHAQFRGLPVWVGRAFWLDVRHLNHAGCDNPPPLVQQLKTFHGVRNTRVDVIGVVVIGSMTTHTCLRSPL